MAGGPAHSDRLGDRPVLVEFFGMPGSGKTTVSRDLLARFGAGGGLVLFSGDLTWDDLPGRPRSLRRIARILRETPAMLRLWPVLRAVAGLEQASLRDKLKSLFVCATVGATLAHVGRGRFGAVFDQGPAQALWSAQLMARGTTDLPDDLLPRFRALAPGHRWHVVVLTAPEQTVRSRLESRPGKHSRLQSDAAGQAAGTWKHADLLTGRICDRLRDEAGAGGITLSFLSSADASPAELAEQIERELVRCAN